MEAWCLVRKWDGQVPLDRTMVESNLDVAPRQDSKGRTYPWHVTANCFWWSDLLEVKVVGGWPWSIVACQEPKAVSSLPAKTPWSETLCMIKCALIHKHSQWLLKVWINQSKFEQDTEFWKRSHVLTSFILSSSRPSCIKQKIN
jgi:hypothetical protein